MDFDEIKVLAKDRLETYHGQPCMYVRWLDDSQQFYIGKTIDLSNRYNTLGRSQVIYFEEVDTEQEALDLERRTMLEFIELNLPLANRVLPDPQTPDRLLGIVAGTVSISTIPNYNPNERLSHADAYKLLAQLLSREELEATA